MMELSEFNSLEGISSDLGGGGLEMPGRSARDIDRRVDRYRMGVGDEGGRRKDGNVGCEGVSENVGAEGGRGRGGERVFAT